MTRGLVACAATVAAMLTVVPASSAGVLSLSEESHGGPIPTLFDYAGLPGEANRVHAILDEGGQQLTILDPGQLILPQTTQLLDVLGHCSIEIGKAVCRGGDAGIEPVISLRLADGADTVRISGPLDSSVEDGPGNDVIHGGPNRDGFHTGPGADYYSGGGGRDSVDYFDRTVNLRIDLDGVADDGAAGERDNVRADIEGISAGSGDDVLVGADQPVTFIGSEGRDSLVGGPAADVLRGNNGDDTLTGGPGFDLIEGNGGADLLQARDGERDRVVCDFGFPAQNFGIDTVIGDLIDDLTADCDVIDLT